MKMPTSRNEKRCMNVKAKVVSVLAFFTWGVGAAFRFSHAIGSAEHKTYDVEQCYMCTQLCALNIFSHLYVPQHFSIMFPGVMHAYSKQHMQNSCSILPHDFSFHNSYVSSSIFWALYFTPDKYTTNHCKCERFLFRCRLYSRVLTAWHGKRYRLVRLFQCACCFITVIILLNFSY